VGAIITQDIEHEHQCVRALDKKLQAGMHWQPVLNVTFQEG